MHYKRFIWTCCSIVGLFFQNGLNAQHPGWTTPSGASFSHNASVIAVAYLNDVRSDNLQDRVAFFSGATLVGVSSPLMVGQQVIHFVTVYATTTTATLSMKLYHAANNTVYEVQGQYAFIAQQLSGSFELPFELRAYLGGDAPISLNDIPNQYTLENSAFEPIYLRQYLVQTDMDPIVWAVSTNPNVISDISQDTLYITPKYGFTGAVSLTVTATEQTALGYTAQTSLSLQVSEKYAGPEWVPVPGEGILAGGTFPTVVLPSYEQQYGGPCLRFDYAPVIALADEPVPPPAWQVNGTFQNTMTITAAVIFTPRYTFSHPDDVLAALVGSEVRGVARPQTINGRTYFFLSIGNNTSTAQVTLLFYSGFQQQVYTVPMPVSYVSSAVLGSPDQPYVLDLSPLLPVIDDAGNLHVVVQQAAWRGQLRFNLIAMDCTYPTEINDTTGIVLCVSDADFTPGSIATIGETVCYAGTPMEIGTSISASGANGMICYSWRSSTDHFSVPIPGANSATYTPPAGITETTSYRRYVKYGLCEYCPTLSVGTWTVTVLPAPEIVCPDNQVVFTSTDGNGDCTGTTSWINPVELAGACLPLSLTIQTNNELPISILPGHTEFRSLTAGTYTSLFTLTDGGGNEAQCSFTITMIDDEAPILQCTNDTIVIFNGEALQVLSMENFGTVSDNCVDLSLSFFPPLVRVSELGQIIPVLVLAQDTSGNVSTCVSHLEITGLPDGWSHNNGTVGNCNSSMDYNPHTGIWTANAANCITTSPFTNDVQLFAQRSLCGNGSITARMTGITGGSAWAGVIMRENTAVGAKKIQLMVNGVSNVGLREWRTSTGGQAYPATFSNVFVRNWVRIVREGDVFKGYTSSDGATWWQVMQIYIPMSSCIEIGLVVNNVQANVNTTVTFAHVQATGNRTPSAMSPVAVQESVDMPTFDVYPNPSSGEINLSIHPSLAAIATIRIFNQRGQLVQTSAGEINKLLLHDVEKGLYLVQLCLQDGRIMQKRVILH